MTHIKDNEFKKNNLRGAGFDKEVDNVEAGNCPICGGKINMDDFEDDLSKREFQISGMCQHCINKIFKEPEE